MRNFFIIVYALIIRDINLRFNKGYLKYLWLILEPVVHLLIWILIFTLFKKSNISGIDTALFLITGLIPWFFFQRSFSNASNAYNSGKALFSYRQISLFHILISIVVLELIIHIALFIIILSMFLYLGINFYIYNILNLIVAFILIGLLTIGISFVIIVFSMYFPDFARIKAIFIRPLYFMSGIFFTYESIPDPYKDYFVLNPMFQLIELVRCSFVEFNYSSFIDMAYLVKFILLNLTLGIGLYFINREKIARNDLIRD